MAQGLRPPRSWSLRLLGIVVAAGPFSIAPLPAQAGGTHQLPPPAGGYKGPGDLQPVAPPEKPEEGPKDDGRRFPFGPLTIQPANPPAAIPALHGAPLPVLGLPPPPDTSEWLLWWRLQRWQCFEDLSAPSPSLALTPVHGDRGPPPAPPAAPSGDPAALALPVLLHPIDGVRERPEYRAERMLALARCGTGPQVGKILREGLADPDDRVVETAILGFGILGKPHGLPLLSEVLRGEAPPASYHRHEWTLRQRALAAYALGVLASRTTYPALRTAESAPLLATLPRGRTPGAEIATACCLALGQFPAADAPVLLPELLGVLRDTRRLPPIRAAAAVASARLATRSGNLDLARATERVLARSLTLSSEAAELRQACALGIGRLGTLPELASICTELLLRAPKREADPRVRRLALLGLAEIASGSHPIAQTKVLPTLLAGLQDGTDQDRAWHALALGWAGIRATQAGRSLPPLVAERLAGSFPTSNRMRTRAASGLALGLLGADSAAPLLRDALESVGQDEFQAELSAGLALLDRPQDRSALLRHWRALDPFSEGWQAVAAALAHRDPDRLRLELIRLGKRPGLDHATAYAAATAYGWLHGPEDVPPLVAILEDPKQSLAVRVAALRSLGRVAERTPERWNAGYLDLLVPYAAPPTLLGTPERPGVADRP